MKQGNAMCFYTVLWRIPIAQAESARGAASWVCKGQMRGSSYKIFGGSVMTGSVRLAISPTA
jgi:hypothetical protein